MHFTIRSYYSIAKHICKGLHSKKHRSFLKKWYTVVGDSMKKIIIDENNHQQRIDRFLKKYLPNAPSGFIYKLIRKKDIKVNGKRVNESFIIQTGDVLELFLYEDKFDEYSAVKTIYDLPQNFDVVYEDQHILIVNKPSGLLVHEDEFEKINTLNNQVINYLYKKQEFDNNKESTFTPGPVHRIDRNTSGLVIFAKSYQASKVLHEMMKKRNYIKKNYLCIVEGKLEKRRELEGYVIKDEVAKIVRLAKKEEENALYMKTIYTPIIYNDKYSLLDVELVTGRTHQIRIHMAAIHHPLIGDKKYGNFELNKMMKEQYQLNYQFLHAYKLTFTYTFGCLEYLKGKEFEIGLPKKLEKIKNSLFPS